MESTTSLVHRHDGHHVGHLNCIAVRHGWTRTFSISPDELAHMDFAGLERVLELPTLRLRPLALRVFVEHPPASGTFCKIRPWKDDGSLQAVLIRAFLTERLEAGGVTHFELRDGRNRAEDDPDADSLAPSAGTPLARLRRKVSGRTATDDSAAAVPPPVPPKKRTGAFALLDLLRLPRQLRPSPPRSSQVAPAHAAVALGDGELSEDEGDGLLVDRPPDAAEEDAMRRRGWVPPLFKRGGRRGGGGGDDDVRLRKKGAGKGNKNGKGKGRAFGGAERISRPEDALPAPTPPPGGADPFEDQD